MSVWIEIALLSLLIVANGFFAGSAQTVVAMRPPGFSTRAISRAACAMSGKNM